jgi:drug/metabolite transporter (DMT)-like permease
MDSIGESRAILAQASIMERQTKILNRAAPAVFVLLWASGFVVARLTASHVEPVSFLAYRFPLAALLMLGLVLAFKEKAVPQRDAIHAATVGFFLHAGYLAPIYWAVTHGLPGGVSALIVGLQPLVTAFMAVPVLGERVSGKHWLGLVTGIIGVALVLSPKFSFQTIGGITPLTAGLGVVGMLCATIGTIYQKRFASHIPFLSSVMWQYVGASLAVVAFASLTENFGFDGSWQAWAGLLWATVVISLGAILILMRLIRDGEVAKVSTLIFLVPGVTALITWVMFNETLSLLQIIGMIVTACAVMIVNRKTVDASG